MLGTYRFMDSIYLDGTVGGDFRFGRLIKYRLQELAEGDEWIGDRNEGVMRGKIPFLEISPEQKKSARDEEIIRAMGMNLDLSNSSIKIENSVMYADIDCFILSFSTGEFAKLKRFMCRPENADYAYNGCIEVQSLKKIADPIWYHGTCNRKPVKECFDGYEFGDVDYIGNEEDVTISGVSEASPFRKHSKYKSQSEARIVLYPKAEILDDYVHVKVPPNKRFIREVARNIPVVDKISRQNMDTRSTQELIEFICRSRIIAEYFDGEVSEVDFGTPNKSREITESISRSYENGPHLNLVKAYYTLREREEGRFIDGEFEKRLLYVEIGVFHLIYFLNKYISFLKLKTSN